MSEASPPSLFVLDRSVLLQDPSCLFQFTGADLHLPLSEIEALDQAKIGLAESAQNARQASRWLDSLLQQHAGGLEPGIDRHWPEQKAQTALSLGRLFFGQTPERDVIAATEQLQQQHPERTVILVSSDINTRLKAIVRGLNAEDYLQDRVLDDAAVLYRGFESAPAPDGASDSDASRPLAKDDGPERHRHHGVLFDDLPETLWHISAEGETHWQCERSPDFQGQHSVWGIRARNAEQAHALHLLMNADIDLVTLCGHAGTGKTLLALAAALQQTLEAKRYKEVIVTRVTVPLGDDIGFLPGTEEEKMTPWMGALTDNVEVLCGQTPEQDNPWQKQVTAEMVMEHIKVRSLNFMRGRTFFERFVIVDEAQNLTPKQMKALITRAGPGTKMVCLGNLAQIDTPYLSETSSGLTYLIQHFKRWPHSAHLILSKGERSRLAEYAAGAL